MSARLIVNATILNQARLTGLGVYTANLLPLLLRFAAEDDRFRETVIAGAPDSIRATLGTCVDHPKIRICAVTARHPLHRLVALDRLVVSERQPSRDTVFYSPTHHGVVRRGLIQVITVHDLFARLFPHNYRQQYYYFRWYLPRVLARTSRVIVDAGITAGDLQHFYPNCPPTEIVHAAIRADLPAVSPKEIPVLLGQRFFLFVGPSYWYKNCVRLIDAFSAYRRAQPGKLVFVGGRDAYIDELKQHLQAKHGGLIDDVIFFDYVGVSELAWLYRNAVALMITTLYEGFGLPALEAMACGCPVIASRSGSLPEVCGAAARYVDPEGTDQIYQAMQEMCDDGPARRRLISAGTENVGRFNWGTAARQVYDALTRLA